MSGAMTRYPASESALIWCLQEYQDSGNPWHKRTRGPVPASAKWILMPFDSTNLCSVCIENLAVSSLAIIALWQRFQKYERREFRHRAAISVSLCSLEHDKLLKRLQVRVRNS